MQKARGERLKGDLQVGHVTVYDKFFGPLGPSGFERAQGPLGPLGFECSQHKQTLRPTVDGTRSLFTSFRF